MAASHDEVAVNSQGVSHGVSQGVQQGSAASDCNTSTIPPNSGGSGNAGNTPTPTELDRVAAQRGNALSKGSLGRFVALYDMMTGDYAKHDREGYETQTVGGIVYISNRHDWINSEGYTGAEVAEYVRVGWLMRGGKGNKWLYIAQAGQDAYEDYYHYEQAAA